MDDRKKMLRDLLATPAERAGRKSFHDKHGAPKVKVTPEERSRRRQALVLACDTMREVFEGCDTDDDAVGTLAVFDALYKLTDEQMMALLPALMHLSDATGKLVPLLATLVALRGAAGEQAPDAVAAAKQEFLDNMRANGDGAQD